MSAPAGTARITQGDGDFLTPFNENAAVGLGQEKEWKIRPAGANNCDAVVITLKGDGGEEKCLTLDSNSNDSDGINIMVKPLESPPTPEQVWTLEECIIQPRYPPIAHGRMQSVAKPELSAAIGGDMPLPRIFMSVAAVPHEGGDMDMFGWRFDYTSVE